MTLNESLIIGKNSTLPELKTTLCEWAKITLEWEKTLIVNFHKHLIAKFLNKLNNQLKTAYCTNRLSLSKICLMI